MPRRNTPLALIGCVLLCLLTSTSRAQETLAPLWPADTQPPNAGAGTRAKHQAERLALPLVATTSLPEDAAWEGWVTPGLKGRSGLGPIIADFHGKLCLGNVAVAGHVASTGLVSWDGTHFEAMPAVPGFVTAMTVWNDQLVAATEPGGNAYSPGPLVLVLNGAVWDTLGRPDDLVDCMISYNGDLVVGGRFAMIDGQPARQIARFNGTAWTDLGSGLTGPEVTTLVVHAGRLIAGGCPAPNLAIAWDEALGTWQPLGGALNGAVACLVSDGVTLYGAGSFVLSGETAVTSFAKWNGSSWSAVAAGFNTGSQAVLWNGGVVVPRVAATSRLSFWNGSQLAAMSDSIGFGGHASRIDYLGTWGNDLVVSGGFYSNGVTAIGGVLIYDGVNWTAPLVPWDDQMLSPEGQLASGMITWNGKLVLGTTAGISADHDHFTPTFGLGVWDGTHWSTFGDGLAGLYKWFATYQGDLVVTGQSLTPTGTTIHRVARWNGSSWSGFGTGARDFGNALQEFHTDLYQGFYPNGGGVGILRWDGTAWQSVGGGLSHPPYSGGECDALCTFGDSLVVGGYFSVAGTTAANSIAFWDGAAWHAAGDGFAPNDGVLALAVWNGHLIAGGGLTATGTQTLHGAAIWDGNAWQPFGTNAEYIISLRVADGALFASGDFILSDNSVVSSVARWNGTDWHVLGSGSDSYSFEIFNGYLYNAGMGIVHGHVSHGLSRIPLYATLDTPRPQSRVDRLALAISPNPARASARLAFSLPTSGHVRLTLHDVSGREVARPADGEFIAGPHQLAWPVAAAPGIYFARLQSAAGVKTTRFVVLGR